VLDRKQSAFIGYSNCSIAVPIPLMSQIREVKSPNKIS